MSCFVLNGVFIFFFVFNDTATTEIYTLSLHDALPISTGPDSPVKRRRGPANAHCPVRRWIPPGYSTRRADSRPAVAGGQKRDDPPLPSYPRRSYHQALRDR